MRSCPIGRCASERSGLQRSMTDDTFVNILYMYPLPRNRRFPAFEKKSKKVKKGVDKGGYAWYINQALGRRAGKKREFQKKLKKPLDKPEQAC